MIDPPQGGGSKQHIQIAALHPEMLCTQPFTLSFAYISLWEISLIMVRELIWSLQVPFNLLRALGLNYKPRKVLDRGCSFSALNLPKYYMGP